MKEEGREEEEHYRMKVKGGEEKVSMMKEGGVGEEQEPFRRG